MSLPKILVCLDSDRQPSLFDGVVAVDAGVDHLFRHGGVEPHDVRDLVYGAMFTRAPADLKNTAIFIGGSQIEAGERLLAEVTRCFFGPMRVSVMLDSAGSNTTAAAAVVAVGRHVDLASAEVALLAGTGAVGKRVARLLASEGARVRIGTRSKSRGEQVAKAIRAELPKANFQVVETTSESGVRSLLAEANVVIAAGPPGVRLLSQKIHSECKTLQVSIDLNAVPPLGIEAPLDIEAIGASDKPAMQGETVCYGAIGVGGTKMKIHRAAITQLFESNDQQLNLGELYALGKTLESTTQPPPASLPNGSQP